jgi:hypothetical protein
MTLSTRKRAVSDGLADLRAAKRATETRTASNT